MQTGDALGERCYGCGKPDTDNSFKSCSTCREMKLVPLRFCSDECLEQSWPKHKQFHKQQRKIVQTGKESDQWGETDTIGVKKVIAELRAGAGGKAYSAAYARGLEHFAKKHWSKAAKKLEEAIQLNPASPEAYFSLGCTMECSGHFAPAAQAYLQSCERYGTSTSQRRKWACAVAHAFHVLNSQACRTMPKPEWWDDEGLQQISSEVIAAILRGVPTQRTGKRAKPLEAIGGIGAAGDGQIAISWEMRGTIMCKSGLWPSAGRWLPSKEDCEKAATCFENAAKLEVQPRKKESHLKNAHMCRNRAISSRWLSAGINSLATRGNQLEQNFWQILTPRNQNLATGSFYLLLGMWYFGVGFAAQASCVAILSLSFLSRRFEEQGHQLELKFWHLMTLATGSLVFGIWYFGFGFGKLGQASLALLLGMWYFGFGS